MAKKGLDERLKDFEERHPFALVAKYAVALWVTAWSVWGPVQSCQHQAEADRRQAAEDKRAGLLDEPEVQVAVRAEGCSLLNFGVRPIAQATVIWKQYALTADPCHIGGSLTQSHWHPAAAADTLTPRARLDATVPQGAEPMTRLPIFTADSVLFVECEGRYHRDNDLGTPFVKRSVGIWSQGSILPLNTLYAMKGGRLVWKNERYGRAHACFAARPDRNAGEAVDAMLAEGERQLRQLSK